jgi:predicted enzyme related to lactoylglutathione lyase
MIGQIWWLEVPCKSVPRAAAFYSAVLGWTCADPEKGSPAPAPGTESVHVFKCGLLTGAFAKMAAEDDVASAADAAHPGRMPVLATYLVASIDEALAKVEKVGGKVHVYVAWLFRHHNARKTSTDSLR